MSTFVNIEGGYVAHCTGPNGHGLDHVIEEPQSIIGRLAADRLRGP